MPKDRIRQRFVVPHVSIVIDRSTEHPVQYAIVLRDGCWHAVRTFDNAHAPDEHHEHPYIGMEKQPPIVTHGPINEAMHAAEIKLLDGWDDTCTSGSAPDEHSQRKDRQAVRGGIARR